MINDETKRERINSAIPLLGGVPFYGGEGAFWFFLIT
jgi:hypothetical protein